MKLYVHLAVGLHIIAGTLFLMILPGSTRNLVLRHRMAHMLAQDIFGQLKFAFRHLLHGDLFTKKLTGMMKTGAGGILGVQFVSVL